MNEENLLTLDEVAERTKLPKSWFYSRTYRRGNERVPHLKCRKYLRFRFSEVLGFLEKQQVSQPA